MKKVVKKKINEVSVDAVVDMVVIGEITKKSAIDTINFIEELGVIKYITTAVINEFKGNGGIFCPELGW